MKRLISSIAALFMIGAMTLSGCTKDKNIAAATIKPTLPGKVVYNVATETQDPNSFLRWDGGYFTTSVLTFSGTKVIGNALQMDQYTANALQTVSLFAPLTLGTISIPKDKFDYISLSATLTPVTATLTPGGGTHALYLGGIFRLVDDQARVQFIVDEQIILSGEWLANISITNPTYLATQYLDFSQLMVGIHAIDFTHAARQNGEIIISSEFNPNLYIMMLRNLQTRMRLQFKPLYADPSPYPPRIAPNPAG